MLEDAEKTSQHINNIKSVTDDGEMLFNEEGNDDLILLSSQDVLERIKLFHDVED